MHLDFGMLTITEYIILYEENVIPLFFILNRCLCFAILLTSLLQCHCVSFSF